MKIKRLKKRLKKDISRLMWECHYGCENWEDIDMVHQEFKTVSLRCFKGLVNELAREGELGKKVFSVSCGSTTYERTFIWMIKLVDRDGAETRFITEYIHG